MATQGQLRTLRWEIERLLAECEALARQVDAELLVLQRWRWD